MTLAVQLSEARKAHVMAHGRAALAGIVLRLRQCHPDHEDDAAITAAIQAAGLVKGLEALGVEINDDFTAPLVAAGGPVFAESLTIAKRFVRPWALRHLRT